MILNTIMFDMIVVNHTFFTNNCKLHLAATSNYIRLKTLLSPNFPQNIPNLKSIYHIHRIFCVIYNEVERGCW